MIKFKKIPPWFRDVFAVLLILCTAPLFIFKLGASSLVSFDEAWYAGIARNIVQSNDWLRLSWNGQPFFDHPPAGFWFQALSFRFLGISEFSARLPSAIFALVTLITAYFLGKLLFNRVVGLFSALALSSSIWFVFRARSADLDIFLTCFFVLSIYLALKATKNKLFLYPFAVSLSFLFLTKTGIPVVIVPTILLIFIFKRGHLAIRDFIFPLVLFGLIVIPWFQVNYQEQSNFLDRYFKIGFPKEPTTATPLQNFILIRDYLHQGMGRWFWPGVLGVLGGLLLFPKRFWVISFFSLTFFLPFIATTKGHIWHVIPLHPLLILAFFGFVDTFITRFTKKPYLAWVIMLAFGFWVGFNQTKVIWYQFIDIPAYVSDEAILSRKAAEYPYTFYIDDNYWPTAFFYSGKPVRKYSAGTLRTLFDSKEDFILITTQFRLNDSGIFPAEYSVIQIDRDKILLTRAPK